MMVGVSLVFGTLRWMDVPPQASVLIMAILGVSVAAAVALAAAIASSRDE